MTLKSEEGDNYKWRDEIMHREVLASDTGEFLGRRDQLQNFSEHILIGQ